MGIAPNERKTDTGLRASFSPVLRALTGAFLNAENNNPLAGSSTTKAAHEAGKQFDAMIGQNFVFGVEAMDKLRILTSTAASAAGVIHLQAERKQKEREEDAQFRRILEMIREGQVGAYIADEIFDGKADWEILQIVADIEAATGDSFENYAKAILGEENLPERLDGESDADHQRRVLKAITAEILDPNTGRIKPEYADDPVAKIVAREEAYTRTIAEISDTRAQAHREGATTELIERTEAVSQRGYTAARDAAEGVGESALVATARDGEDGHRDTALVSVDNTDLLGGILGGSDALDEASRDVNTEFERASAQTDEPTPDAPEQGIAADLTLKG